MADQIAIREATSDDIPTIVTHRRRMFEDMGNRDSAALNRMESCFRSWLEDHIRTGRYRSFLACTRKGRVVAGSDIWLVDWPPGQFDVSPYRGYILNVYTHPDYRRRGLARRLVSAAMEWCYANGIHVISLHASPGSGKLYEELGFTRTSELSTWKDRSEGGRLVNAALRRDGSDHPEGGSSDDYPAPAPVRGSEKVT